MISTATINDLRKELGRIQSCQAECVTDSGYVKPEFRHKYQMLTRESMDMIESIEWLKKLE